MHPFRLIRTGAEPLAMLLLPAVAGSGPDAAPTALVLYDGGALASYDLGGTANRGGLLLHQDELLLGALASYDIGHALLANPAAPPPPGSIGALLAAVGRATSRRLSEGAVRHRC